MKFESADPDSELHGNARIDCHTVSIDDLDIADADMAQSYHDIRASLAIINGFSNALESSFQELKDQYDQVQGHNEEKSNTASSDRLMALEADCRFCLSRLCSSVEQLKESLKAGGVLRDSSQD